MKREKIYVSPETSFGELVKKGVPKATASRAIKRGWYWQGYHLKGKNEEMRKEENAMTKKLERVGIRLETEKVTVKGQKYRKIINVVLQGCAFREWPRAYGERLMLQGTGIYPHAEGIYLRKNFNNVNCCVGGLFREENFQNDLNFIRDELATLNASIDEANRLAEEWQGKETFIL